MECWNLAARPWKCGGSAQSTNTSASELNRLCNMNVQPQVARPEALSSETITSVLETVKAGRQTPAEGAMEVDGEQEG